jgi:predicted kinase
VSISFEKEGQRMPGRHVLVVVCGAPASGKTELSGRLADAFQLPLLAKDQIKDPLLDRLGAVDIVASQVAGHASMDLLFVLLRSFLGRGVSLLVEAPFSEKLHGDRLRQVVTECGPRVVQVHCRASEDVLRDRLLSRTTDTSRHRGHFDVERLNDTLSSARAGFWAPVPLPGATVIDWCTDESPGERIFAGLVAKLTSGIDTGRFP